MLDGNKYFSTDDEADAFSLDDIEETDRYTDVAVVRKCLCGYRGPLIPDIHGLQCENCGHVLIER